MTLSLLYKMCKTAGSNCSFSPLDNYESPLSDRGHSGVLNQNMLSVFIMMLLLLFSDSHEGSKINILQLRSLARKLSLN